MAKSYWTVPAFSAVFLAGAALTAPSFASSEAECEAAIAQAQQESQDQIAVEDNTARANEVTTMLARAGEEGIKGNYDRCLEMVRDARGAAGIPEEHTN